MRELSQSIDGKNLVPNFHTCVNVIYLSLAQKSGIESLKLGYNLFVQNFSVVLIGITI